MIRFTVPGDPVPKARARVVQGDDGRFRGVTPARTRAYEESVGWALREAYAGNPLSGPLRVTVAVFERKRAPQHHGDLDNYLKAVLDALNGIAWDDDRQIVRLVGEIERGARAPRVEVEIEETISRSSPIGSLA